MLFYYHLVISRDQYDGQNPSLVTRAYQKLDKPTTPDLIIGIISDLTCNLTDLVVENVLLAAEIARQAKEIC